MHYPTFSLAKWGMARKTTPKSRQQTTLQPRPRPLPSVQNWVWPCEMVSTWIQRWRILLPFSYFILPLATSSRSHCLVGTFLIKVTYLNYAAWLVCTVHWTQTQQCKITCCQVNFSDWGLGTRLGLGNWALIMHIDELRLYFLLSFIHCSKPT